MNNTDTPLNNLDLLLRTYGTTLDMPELAAVFKVTYGALMNKISAGRCPVPTYLEGGKRLASARAVAEHLDRREAEAAAALEVLRRLQA